MISSQQLPVKYNPKQSLLKEVMLGDQDMFAGLGIVMAHAFCSKLFRLVVLPLVLQFIDQINEAIGDPLEELINYKTLD